MRPALLGQLRAAALSRSDVLHGAAKILVRTGPARRINAGFAVERVHRQSEIVGEGRQPRRRRGGHRLDARIVAKVVPVSSGSAQPKLAGRYRVDAVGGQQALAFPELAGIVGRDHQRPVIGDALICHVRHRTSHRSLGVASPCDGYRDGSCVIPSRDYRVLDAPLSRA